MTQADLSLIAIVTGANRGIGLEVVCQLAHQGMTVSNSTPAYSTSKAALNAFTRQLAAELKGTGILVNIVLINAVVFSSLEVRHDYPCTK